MKKIIFMSVLAVILALTAFISMGKEKKRNTADIQDIAVLWKEYGEAREADKPQKMASVLENIKTVAMQQRKTWDYYKACHEYVDAVSMRNWKLRDSLEAGFRNEIAEYDEPVLSLIHMLDRREEQADSVLGFIHDNAGRLKKSRNSDVYRNRFVFNENNPLMSVMLPLVADDYEYALWELLNMNGWTFNHVSQLILEELEASFGDEYPKRGFARWLYAEKHITGNQEMRHEYMKKLAEEYDGRAFSLLPRQCAMEYDFMSLQEKNAGSEEYLKFRDSLLLCEKERKSYRDGIDAAIAKGCKGFGIMLETLQKKGATVSIDDGIATVCLRNMPEAKVRLFKDDKKVYETVLDNPVRSFYAFDTLRFEMPDIDDGEYRFECLDGVKVLGGCSYVKYTMSMAIRTSKGGLGLYVADYMSGKPVDKVDVLLYKGDRLVAEAQDVGLDGFTALPEALASKLESGTRTHGFNIQCRAKDSKGRLMLTPMSYISSGPVETRTTQTSVHAIVMTDRAAFNHGDTVRFKTVAYEAGTDGAMSACREGREVLMKLIDPQGKMLSEKSFVTNDFGSCAGDFVLDDVARNGIFTLAAFADGRRIGSRSVRVDEFVLPTFELVFDDSGLLYLPGDTVKVSGRIISYSGHNLSSAAASAQILRDGRLVSENPLSVASDGTFVLTFVADCGLDTHYAGYEIKVRITDATGETLEFSRYESVSRGLMLDVELENPADGLVSWPEEAEVDAPSVILSDETALVGLKLMRNDGKPAEGVVSYEIYSDGEVVAKGAEASGTVAEIDFSALPSGMYRFVARASATDGYGRSCESERALCIIKVRDADKTMNVALENMIRVLPGDQPAVAFAAGNGSVWAVFELFGDDGSLLGCEMVHLDGVPGKEGSLITRRYEHRNDSPEGLRLNIFYFHNGRRYFWTHLWRRTVKDVAMPLEITRFMDQADPSSDCVVTLKTSAQAEVLASVFDVASEKIMANRWNLVRRMQSRFADVSVRAVCGRDTNNYRAVMGDAFGFSGFDVSFGLEEGAMLEENVVIGYGARRGLAGAARGLASMRASKSNSAVEMMDMVSVEEESVEAEVMADAAVPVSDVVVREDFSTTLAFEPFLYPDADGNLELEFRTSDKLSTFVVSLFAHDRQMNTAVLRKDMAVTLPVKVSVVEPQYLHQGDKYILKASVSNNSEHALRGMVMLDVYHDADYRNADPAEVMQLPLRVVAGSVSEVEFEVDVPQVDTLGFRISFAGGYEPEGMAVCDVMIHDAVFVDVQVLPAHQTLVEAHSAVLLPGMSEEDLILSLRERFVNVSSVGAEYSSVSIMKMLREALPLVAEAEGRDVISQSEAMYVNLLGGALRVSDPSAGGPSYRDHALAAMTAAGKILACANADGGFGWFEGMTSSPVVTAVVLERYAGLRDRGVLSLVSEELGEDALEDFSEAVAAAVRYLDKSYFARNARPFWYGGLSQLQYMSVRSMYVGIPFDAAAARKDAGSERWKAFTKGAKELLVPKKGDRWTDGAILAKARMLRIISALTSSESGAVLASAWGLKSSARMLKSFDDELSSLMEYAVSHPSGGIYYPNAVLPWRGLLESEAYAHAYIADLMKDLSALEPSGTAVAERMDEIADGIRIWLMLQKETQQWADDPGFVDALSSVYDASPQAREVKVIVLKKRYRKPFGEIKAVGNGMKVGVRYYKELPAKDRYSEPQRLPLDQGDSLAVGDKVIAVYSLWSEENRSFVRLSVPRAALFRPADQLSGWSGGWLRTLTYGFFNFSPYCYREVKADRTLYWMDVCPEEDTLLEEVLFVTQDGVFASPVAEIECLYAPHYRANDDGGRQFMTIF